MREQPGRTRRRLILFHNLLLGGYFLLLGIVNLQSPLPPKEPGPDWSLITATLLTGAMMVATAACLLVPPARRIAMWPQRGAFWGHVILVTMGVIEILSYTGGGIRETLNYFLLLLFVFWTLLAFRSVLHLRALVETPRVPAHSV